MCIAQLYYHFDPPRHQLIIRYTDHPTHTSAQDWQVRTNPACRRCDGSLSPEHLRGSEARCVLLTLADYHSIKTRSTKVNRPQYEINRLGGHRGQYDHYYHDARDAPAPPGQPTYPSYRGRTDYK